MGLNGCAPLAARRAWASTVQFYSPTNYFGVRKGQVAVLITSTSDYPYMRDLMKAVLKQL